MKLLINAFLAIFAGCPLWANSETLPKLPDQIWMGRIDGEKYLHELSIPGSHDSGALYDGLVGQAKSQDMGITGQLNSGVRFLDIRCRHINDAFVIHHGQVYQNANFNDVLREVTSFLAENPSETVIMSVKQEYDPENNTRSFAETFTTYVGKNPSLWHLATSVPKLKDVRGKIVLLRRFNKGPIEGDLGIIADNNGWPDDDTGTITGPPRIRVQDVYKVWDRGNKWGYIKALINEMPNNPGTLYLNFTSGYSPLAFGIPDIKYVTIYINPRLGSFFDNATSGRYGIIIMDYVDGGLARSVYETNFPLADRVPRPAATTDPGLAIEIVGGRVDLSWKNWDSEPFDDLNGNGFHDQAEPFVDLNNNGALDPVVERYVDLEVSSDLTNWTTIAQDIDSGSFVMATGSSDRQFYRLNKKIAPDEGASTKLPLVMVPGGTYPGHGFVPTFWIGRFEVTWSHWQNVRDWAVDNGYPDLAGVGEGSGPLHPVRNVGWYDAVKWCNALSEKEGLSPSYFVDGVPYRTGESDNVVVDRTVNGYRLPTTDEWWVAASGANLSNGYWCSGSNNEDDVAWYLDNSIGAEVGLSNGRGTWPVGVKAANELGIHDMSGNVREWCEEQNETYIGPIPIADIRRLASGGWWGSEGGQYGAPGEFGDLNILNPEPLVPNFRGWSLGLRVVRGR